MWWKKLIFTGFYSGYLPFASGTAAAIIAMSLYFLEFLIFGKYVIFSNLIILLVLFFPSIKIADYGEKYFGRKDPKEVVIDEIIGYWISVAFFPFGWRIMIIAFFLFRIFDILKPYPIKKLEKCRGGIGIVLDDAVSGVYANLILRVIIFIAGLSGINI